jgi:hypothetical protein
MAASALARAASTPAAAPRWKIGSVNEEDPIANGPEARMSRRRW